MKNSKLRLLVASISIATIATTNSYISHAEIRSVVIDDIEKVSIIKERYVPFQFLQFKSRGQALIEEANKIKAEREEEQRKLEEERKRIEEEQRKIREEKERLARLEKERKESVGVNINDLLEPSHINGDELHSVFMKMGKPEMAEISYAIVEAELLTGVNAIFLAGLICNESAYGTSYKAVYQNNYSGFGVFNSQTEGASFSSAYECIVETAQWLKEQYLSPEGSYFYGYSIYDVNTRYCLTENGSTTDYNWSSIIGSIASRIETLYHQTVN